LSPCPLQKFISKTIPIQDTYPEHSNQALCDIYDETHTMLVCCLREITPSIDAAGPISCLSNTTHLSYLLPTYLLMTDLPLSCDVVSDGLVRLPNLRQDRSAALNTSVERILKSEEMSLGWEDPWQCHDCEHKGGQCAFSSQRNQAFCMPRGIVSNWPVAQYDRDIPFYFVKYFKFNFTLKSFLSEFSHATIQCVAVSKIFNL
jgi:hypothetical protein